MIWIKLNNQKGFTLVEILVSMAISMVALASIYGLFRAQTHSVKGQESRMEAQEYALSVLDTMVREMRNTGYFPSGACTTVPPNVGGIVSADAQSFRLVYDTNGDGTCEEDISFTYDSATKNILRNAVALTDGNATAIQLTYYPQQTAATIPAPYCVSTGVPSGCSGALSSNFANVQSVKVSITAQAKSPDIEAGGQSTITMNSTALLRNHGL